MEQDAYNWISRRAHEIWRQEGHPEGRDRDHWRQAVAEWEDFNLAHNRRAPQVNETKVTNILIVEDDPLIRFTAVDALEAAGFKVFEACSADEALVLLSSNHIEVIFTDVNMPGSIDGLELMKRVRARLPDVRIVVTSGHVALGAFDLAGGVSFLPKPYSLNEVVRMLQAM